MYFGKKKNFSGVFFLPTVDLRAGKLAKLHVAVSCLSYKDKYESSFS